MSDQNRSEKQDSEFKRRIREQLAKADQNREPRFVRGRMGTRMVSLGALRERILERFIDEHGHDSKALQEATTEAKRLSLVLATTDYVLAVESIQIESEQKAELIRRVYADLFSFGPLDSLLDNPDITTISLNGAEKVSVRYGHGDLTQLEPIFETEGHLREMMRRVAQSARVLLDENTPIIEFGLQTSAKRPLCISIAGPPVTYEMTVDIRLHPTRKPVLKQFIDQGIISAGIAQLLRAIFASQHGVIVVGDTESGKTTLLSALLNELPEQPLIAVERAGELRLPEKAISSSVQWAFADQEMITFGQRIGQALEKAPQTLVIDEVRTDEAEAITPILRQDNTPRQIWAFRGPANSKRLAAALGMLARRSDPLAGESIVHSLYEKLPFVVVMRRIHGRLTLHAIAEWQFGDHEAYPDFVELITRQDYTMIFTGKRPLRALNLPEEFWKQNN